jgi:DNA topoisomerase I
MLYRSKNGSATVTAIGPVASAKLAGLKYVDDLTTGIRRVRVGKQFRYLDAHGKVVRRREVLERIRSLVIPPAWTDVWICPSPQGHLQATGRDAKGRKQYRYHPRWREFRDQTKYDRMVAFAHTLPRIRRRTLRHLQMSGTDVWSATGKGSCHCSTPS